MTTVELAANELEYCGCDLSFQEQLSTFLSFAAEGMICQGVNDELFTLIKEGLSFEALRDVNHILGVAIENEMTCLVNFIQNFGFPNPCVDHLWFIAVMDAGMRTFRSSGPPRNQRVGNSSKTKKNRRK